MIPPKNSSRAIVGVLDRSEGRRQSLIVAGRARRQRESSLLEELKYTLPLAVPTGQQYQQRPLDKASVLRLVLCYMRMRQVLGHLKALSPPPVYVHGRRPRRVDDIIDIQQTLAGAHVLVVNTPGIITYVSREEAWSSGLDVMGRSIYDWTHPADYEVVQRLLESDSPATASNSRTELIRFKNSILTGHVIDGCYKVFLVRGKLLRVQGAGGFFVGLVEPTPHPADHAFPMLAWCQRYIVTSFFSPDFKYATFSFLHRVPQPQSSAISRFTGFSLQEVHGASCFSMIHPEDAPRLARQAKILAADGRVLGEFRWLRKSGGYLQVYTQLTTVDTRGRLTTRNPAAIMCRHFLINVQDEGVIVSQAQLQVGGFHEESTTTEQSIVLASPSYETGGTSRFDNLREVITPEQVPSLSTCDLDTNMDVIAEAAELVPSDELETLDEYLQIHSAVWPLVDSNSNGSHQPSFANMIYQ